MNLSLRCPRLKVILAIRAVLGLALILLIRFAVAQGGPPLITDDPGTPGNRHWEINVAFTDSVFKSGHVYELPHVDLNYGYGENLQLKLEGPFTLFSGSGQNFASLGYTNWGVKWRFLNDAKNHPALSTYPQILFAGNLGLAKIGAIDPGTDVFLPLEAMMPFGKFQIDAEFGVLFRQFAATQFSSGICAEYDVSKPLALLGEIHDVTSTQYVQDELIWNLGLKEDFLEHEPLLFSAGRGFGPRGPDNPSFLMYLGVQFRT